MATTTTNSRGKYVDFDEFIDFQLQKTRADIKTTDVLTALAGVGTMFLAYLLVFVVFDHWVVPGGFSPVARWIMLGGLIVACVGWVVWRVVVPYRRNVTGLYAARAIETTEPGLKHTLLNLVDLRGAGRPMPEEIQRALEKRAAVTLSKTNVDAAVDRRPLMRLFYALLVLVVFCCLYMLFSPKKISASVWRALFPASATSVDTTFKIEKVLAEPEGEKEQSFLVFRRDDADAETHSDLKIAARSRVKIVADLAYNGEAPENVRLYYSTRDGKYTDVEVRMKRDVDDDKRYWARLIGVHGRGIMQTTTYRIEAGDAEAGPFTLSVVRPPIAAVQTVRYDYPKYMEREPRTQDGGHIETWEGTSVTVNAETDQPVKEAWLVFTETEDPARPGMERKMTVDDADSQGAGTKLSVKLDHEIAFREDGSHPRFYHIKCVGENGYSDPDPVMYGVTIRRDLPPEIELIDPRETEKDVPANAEVFPMLFKARDPDFKLRFVTLRGEIARAGRENGRAEEVSDPIFNGANDGEKKSLQQRYEWPLRNFNLKPGDEVKFRLEARDNKQPHANTAHTHWVTLRIVEPVDQQQVDEQLQNDRQKQQEQQRRDQQENGGEQQQQPNEGEGQDGEPGEGNQPNEGDPQDGEDGMGKVEPKKGDPKQDGNKQDGDKQDANKQDGDPQNDGQGDQNGKPKQQDGDPANDSPQRPEDGEDTIERLLANREDEQKKDGDPEQKQDVDRPKDDPDGMGEQPQQDQPAEGNEPGEGQRPEDGMDPAKPGNEKRRPGDKEKQPAEEKQPGDGMQGENERPGDGMNPDGGDTPQPGMAQEKSKTPGKEKARKSDQPQDGQEERVPDDGKPAKKKEAKGDETGSADPNDDPDADPTQSKKPNDLKRSDDSDAVKKPGKEPSDPGTKKPSEKEPAGKEPTGTKTGDGMADESDPRKPAKTQDDGDQRKPKTKEKPPAGAKPNPNENQPTNPDGGMEDPDGGADEKPQPGKPDGMGDQPGDQPGEKQPGEKQDGDEGGMAGKGKSAKEKGKQPGSKPGPPGDDPAGDPADEGGEGGEQPGQSGVPQGKQTDREGRGGGNAAGNQPGKAPSNGSPEPEETDLEAGRRLANLVLDNAEGKLKRGEADEEWLKKHGWRNEQQAMEDIQNARRKLQQAEQDPQTKEFVKTIPQMDFQSRMQKRTGSKSQTKAIDGVGSSGGDVIPRQYRRYYRAFDRSVKGSR